MEDNFVFELPNNLPNDFCKMVIDEFENEDESNKQLGSVGIESKKDTKVKTSLDFIIPRGEDLQWQMIDNFLLKKLTEGLKVYSEHIKNTFPNLPPKLWEILLQNMHDDRGYQIQRTDPNGFFSWHSDFYTEKEAGTRLLTFIWYLNTLQPEQEGCTEFIDGTIIKPEAGKLLIFPATWTNIHRGCVLKSGQKYIVTGWLYIRPHTV
ncbi:hypothetical protein APZ24_gp223 [Ostreococcus lucimarinus virus 2]|jgi:hypothetical protein|uniref:hypothetical protein n=1 Tax=Ostreococcus lucimarinus virus 2 TaxID=1663208 RepID=UPI0006D0E244|nr:hypothetical protein APZ24_gp223 [Ostreococcus lucimarinus virus 2]ALI95588.1 hypothetical protein OlV2_225 [Ostreococcus lucimarinus virus 2]